MLAFTKRTAQAKKWDWYIKQVEFIIQNTIVLRLHTLAAAAARNVDAAIPRRSANTELQSAIELHTRAPQIAAILQLQNRISTPKRKNDDFEALFTL